MTRLPSVWRSHFTSKPALRFSGFHRVNNFDHALMDVIASRAPECSDVKAGRSGCDAGQHGSCFACRAKWSEDDHNARLDSGGSTTLSVTG
jgi:hypothetical protein